MSLEPPSPRVWYEGQEALEMIKTLFGYWLCTISEWEHCCVFLSQRNVLIFFLQTTKCDSVFQIILSSMEFESKIAMRRVSYDCLKLGKFCLRQL